jgi:hypothetical protein
MHNTISTRRSIIPQEGNTRRNFKDLDAGHHDTTDLPTPPRSSESPAFSNSSPESPSESPQLIAQQSSAPVITKHYLEGETDVESGNEDGTLPITTESLRSHYIPEIFRRLNGSVTGALGVKDILKHLRQVPNFERLDNQTGRRKLTAALESGIGGEHGNVKYNKVKWGVWEAVPMDAMETDEKPSRTKKSSRPAPISVPALRISGSSITSPGAPSVSSNAIESDSEDEADRMSLDGDGELRSLKAGKRINRRYSPAPEPADDSEVTEDDDDAIASLGRGARRPSAGSYAMSSTSRRDSHVSVGSRVSLSVPGSAAMDIMGNGRNHHKRRHGSGSKPKYLSLPNGSLFSYDVARNMSWNGGFRPFEETYSTALKAAAKEQRRVRRRQSQMSDFERFQHSAMSTSTGQPSQDPQYFAKSYGKVQTAPAASALQPASEMDVARALLALSTNARSPTLSSPSED